MIDARRAGQREVSIHCVVADFPTPCAIMLNLESPHIARLPALQERHRHRSARRPCSRGNDSMLTARIMIRKLLTKHWEQIRAFRIGPTPLAKPIIMTFKQDPFLLPGLIIRHRPHRKNGTGHRLKKHMPHPPVDNRRICADHGRSRRNHICHDHIESMLLIPHFDVKTSRLPLSPLIKRQKDQIPADGRMYQPITCDPMSRTGEDDFRKRQPLCKNLLHHPKDDAGKRYMLVRIHFEGKRHAIVSPHILPFHGTAPSQGHSAYSPDNVIKQDS